MKKSGNATEIAEFHSLVLLFSDFQLIIRGYYMDYTLKRSRRKTMALQITRDLEVVVRAPMRLPKYTIEAFVMSHSQWIEKHLEEQRHMKEAFPEPDQTALNQLTAQAKQVIPPLVEHYGDMMGLAPAGVKITTAKTRFGSCSGKNRLCFSCRLMQYPAEAIEYVVVHELAHIVHKNHGRDFYALIETVLPDYKARRDLLRHRKAPSS